MIDRDACLERDARDPLAPLRQQFALDAIDARGLIYLDGNSLGALPRRTMPSLARIVEHEWGRDLVGSWNSAGWIHLPQRVGDKIAQLVGAGAGELIAGDSTSINLYKALSAAIAMTSRDSPRRRGIVSEWTNFPSDLYIATSLAREHGFNLTLVDADAIEAHLGDETAVVMLTHVNYRTGRMHDMTTVTHAAHDAGALIVWDLAHSAGAVPVALHEADADFAVGCGYKYLNGGPGAPAFLWVHPRHTREMDRMQWCQPLSGWLGHAAPFAFAPEYQPAPGVARFACGTPPILSMAALECGVDVLLETDQYGGIDAIRQKSVDLTELFIALVDAGCEGHAISLVSPRDAGSRGSQVCLALPVDAYAVMQALIARGVIGDFRAPDILRFGFAPLYTRYVDAWDAAHRLSRVLETGEWRDAKFGVRSVVT